MTDESLLTRFADGVWTAVAPITILGMPLSSTMTVIELGAGQLLLHSPISMSSELRTAVEALGTVSHLFAPNTFHHLRVGEWASAYPSARLHAPADLAKKRPDLHIHRHHDVAPEPAFEGILQEVHIDGFRLEETVLVHQPSATAIVADLVHNVGRPDGAWPKLYTKAMGFHDRVAISRMLRWTSFSDRAAARRSLDALLARRIDHLIVGHGTPLTSGAHEALAGAFSWLPSVVD